MSLRTATAGALVLIGSFAMSSADAADNIWIGPGTGTSELWSVGSNWSLSHAPSYPDGAVINDATGDRNITTPAGLTQVFHLQMNQGPAAPGVVNKLTLGGNMNTAFEPFGTTFLNDNANTADQMVLDLNGQTLTGYLLFYLNNMTLRNSGTPGAGKLTTIYGMRLDTAVVENNVTVESIGAFYGGGTWQPGSKLVVTGSNVQYGDVIGGLQNVDFGSASSSSQADMFIQFHTTVKGDLNIHAPTNNNPLLFSGPHVVFQAGGDFIDHAGPAGASYNPAQIVFNGAPSSSNLVQIQRQLVSGVNLRVGNTAVDFGDIELTKSLTTAAPFSITNGSSLDVANNTLTTGNWTQLSSAATAIQLGFDLGTPTGHIAVNGDLTLNNFILDIGGGLAGVNDIVLFTYTGNLIGTPNITGVIIDTVTGKFTYSGLQVGGGQIVLLDVEIPEPSSLGLVALAGIAMLRRRRRQ